MHNVNPKVTVRLPREARAVAERQNTIAKDIAEQQRLELYASDMARAAKYLADGNLLSMRPLIEKHVPGPGEQDLRGFEWKYLKSRLKSDSLLHIEAVGHDVVASADGRFFAYARDGRTEIRDQAPPWRIIRTLEGSGASMSFTPDGELLAFTGKRLVLVYKTADGTLVKRFEGRVIR